VLSSVRSLFVESRLRPRTAWAVEAVSAAALPINIPNRVRYSQMNRRLRGRIVLEPSGADVLQ
jgi:hypothetical protein